MMDFVYTLFRISVCGFEGYLYYGFWEHFLDYRIQKRKIRLFIMAIAMAILFGANHLQLSFFNLAISAGICIGACMVIFGGGRKSRIYCALISYIIMAGCELLITILFGIGSGRRTIDYVMGPVKSIFYILIIKMVTLVVFKVLEACFKDEQDISEQLKEGLWFCCFPLVCIIVYMSIWYSGLDFEILTWNICFILAGCALLLCSNIVLFAVYKKMVRIMTQINAYKINEERSSLENQHYQIVEQMEQRQRILLHNMSDYLKTIEVMAGEAENEKNIELLKPLQKSVLEVQREEYCTCPILNAVLNRKRKEAEEQQVDFRIFVEPGFHNDVLDDIDIISVVSNLSNNAIEAASQCEKGYVDVKLYHMNDGCISVYKFENNYKEEPREFHGKFITSKGDKYLHGIGLNYIKSVITRNNGWIDIEYEKGIFRVSIIFIKS